MNSSRPFLKPLKPSNPRLLILIIINQFLKLHSVRLLHCLLTPYQIKREAFRVDYREAFTAAGSVM
jgi:hypothetical protein